VTATLEAIRTRAVAARERVGRKGYLVGAVCVTISTVMLLPLLYSVLASIKPTIEAAATPPT